MNSRTIKISGVGPVLFERSPRARRLNISVKPFSSVRVAVPRHYSYASAAVVVREKIPWINKSLGRMRLLEMKYADLQKKAAAMDRQRAAGLLKARLAFLAAEHGYDYRRVTVRSQKTRWGSCSAKNNISLNFKLCLLPPGLIDYVMVHELVHTRFKNHGIRFWRELEKIVPRVQELRSLLNEHALVLL